MHLSNIRLGFENINFIFATKIDSNEITAGRIFLPAKVMTYDHRKKINIRYETNHQHS
jgi:hypothetical protein